MKLLVFFLFSISLFADSNSSCVELLKYEALLDSDRSIGRSLNERLLAKYRRKGVGEHILNIIADPHRYFENMQARFQIQKNITPSNPRQFDYSDFARPELTYMKTAIAEEMETLNQMLLRQRSRQRGSLPAFNNRLIRDLEEGVLYLEDLLVEIKFHQMNDVIPYDDFVELSYFFSRATGYFDRRNMNFVDRTLLIVEEMIQEYRKFSIQTERQMYHNRDFDWSRRARSLERNLNYGTEMFERGYANNDNLEFLIVPSNAHLGPDIFHRLMNSRVYLVGMSHRAIGADGFLRPGGLFWIHDLRHSVLIHWGLRGYIDLNNIPQSRLTDFYEKVDQWFVDIDRASRQIEDPVLRRVTRRLIFNIHHDRGYPIIPSSAIGLQQEFSMDMLYHLLERTGNGVSMPIGSYTRLPEALEWMQSFWRAKLQEEIDFLGHEPEAFRYQRIFDFNQD